MSEFDTTATTSTDTTAQATPVAATPATFAQPAIPATTPAPATGVPGEDRSGWVPPYRIRETREAAAREAQAQFAQREAQYEAQLKQVQSQLHALVGVQPPQNPEVDQVRQQFAQLYPGLAKMEERSAQLEELLSRSGDLETQTSHYWQTYGRQTMDRLFEHAATSLGSPLTEEGKRALHSSFVGFVQSSPEMQNRYASDPSMVEDFWKAFSSSFIDPVRRSASATVSGRAAVNLPQDTPSGAPRAIPGPQPKDLDERAGAAWAQYQQLKGQG